MTNQVTAGRLWIRKLRLACGLTLFYYVNTQVGPTYSRAIPEWKAKNAPDGKTAEVVALCQRPAHQALCPG
jgi:hypothetical protein